MLLYEYCACMNAPSSSQECQKLSHMGWVGMTNDPCHLSGNLTFLATKNSQHNFQDRRLVDPWIGILLCDLIYVITFPWKCVVYSLITALYSLEFVLIWMFIFSRFSESQSSHGLTDVRMRIMSRLSSQRLIPNNGGILNFNDDMTARRVIWRGSLYINSQPVSYSWIRSYISSKTSNYVNKREGWRNKRVRGGRMELISCSPQHFKEWDRRKLRTFSTTHCSC